MPKFNDFLEQERLGEKAEVIKNKEPSDLETEKKKDTNMFKAGAAGIASGIIKVQEGIVSLGAELVDLGLGTDNAADVEEFFDKINVFEDTAKERTVGKLTEMFTQIGVPGGVGFKAATKMANKALSAKKAGKYMNLKRSASQALGVGAGEATVADTGQIGYFGQSVEDKEGRERAATSLANRLKFGAEGAVFAGALSGVGMAGRAVSAREIGKATTPFGKGLDRVVAGIRSRGKHTPETFALEKQLEREVRAAKTEMENTVVTLDTNVDKIHTATKGSIPYQKKDIQDKLYSQMNDVLTDGFKRVPIKEGVKKVTKKTPQKSVLNNKTTATRKLNKTLNELKVNPDVKTEINMALTQGRNSIDSLSQKLLDMKSVTRKDKRKLLKDLGVTVEANLGKYLNRNYRIYENNKILLPFMRWKPSQEVIQNAKNYLRKYESQLKMEEAGLLTGPQKKGKLVKLKDDEINELVESLVKEGGFKKPGLVKGKEIKFLSYDEKVLQKRKPIPFEIRELLGEIKDPRYNMLNTVNKLSSIVHHHEYLNSLYQLGRKPGNKFIFNANEAGRPDNFVKLDMKTELSNPLNGKYMPKFLAEAVTDALQTKKKTMAQRAWDVTLLYPKAASQAAKTIFSPVTHARNFVSAAAFAAANGNLLNPQNYKQAFDLTMGPALGQALRGSKPLTKEALRRYNELQRLGVINTSVQASELQAFMRDLNWDKIANNDPAGFRGIMKPFFQLKKWSEKTYFAEDDFWKIVNYQGEYNKLLNAKRLYEPGKYAKLTPELDREIMEEAAGIVRDLVPNYDFVAPGIKYIRKLPIGNFVSFPYEIMRTSKNIMQRSITEMNSSNPYIRSIGEKRLFSFGTTVGALPVAAVSAGKMMHGVTENEMEALRTTRPDYQKDNVLVPMGKDKEGRFQFMDLSYSLAYDLVAKPAQILMNQVAQGVRDEDSLSQILASSMGKSVTNIMQPFYGESIWSEAVVDVALRGGRTREGKYIYKEGDPNKELKMMKHTFLDPFIPGSAGQVARISRGVLGMPGKYGEDIKIQNELPGMAGFRIMTVEPEVSLPFAARDFNRKKRQADSLFGGDMFKFKFLNFGKYDSNDIIEDYEAMQRQRFEVFREGHRNVKAYETLGATSKQIGFGLKTLGRKDKAALRIGVYQPNLPAKSKANEFSILSDKYGIPNPWPEALDQMRRIKSSTESTPLDGPNPYETRRIDKVTGETKEAPSMRLPDTDKKKRFQDYLDDQIETNKRKGFIQNIMNKFGGGRQQPPTPQQQPPIPDQGAGAGPTPPPPPNTQGSISQNPAMYKALYPNDPLAQAIVEGRAGPRGYKRGGLVKK